MPEIIRTLIDRRERPKPSVLPEELRIAYGGDLWFPPSGSQRPYAIGNFVSTVDGVVSFEIAGKSGGGDISDAIECGIVKLPRVPVADNIPGGDVPKFRNLWECIGPKMPKKGASKTKNLDPLNLQTGRSAASKIMRKMRGPRGILNRSWAKVIDRRDAEPTFQLEGC